MGQKLFDGDSSDEETEKIEINREFARRYEHNKRREDLQRLEELKKKGVIDSGSDSDESSSSEEEEAEAEAEEKENAKLSKKKDLEFFDALIRVRNKDPILKNKESKLFQSESESEKENFDGDNYNNDGNRNIGGEKQGKEKKDGKKKEKKKPMYLKDVVSKQLIEEGPEFEDEDDNVDKKKVKSYDEEQEELRKAFLKAVEQAEAEEEEEEEEEDGGEFFWEKRKSGGKEDAEEENEIGEKLDEYFGGDEKLDEDMRFLKDYFRNRMWVGDGDDKKVVGDEGMGLGVSEDEEEIERQEDYEREYNFRFEENVGDRVMGHSRVVEGSVRKKTNARKSQRERKEERMAQAEFERKEELKHLKNVKKKEMMEKLRKIREAAGVGEDGAWLLEEDDLEEEFNPVEYDKKMKEAFDDGYYKAEDIDPEFGSDNGEGGDELEKPDFDKEDALLGLPKGWDDMSDSHDGFLSARERILKLKEGGDNQKQASDKEDDAVPEVGKRKKKRKRHPSEVEKAVKDQLMEEYYKLEYEDTIGDLKTRFKYKDVNPKRYGLSAEEILMMDDKELNLHVSIKKLAPYREKEWKVPRIKTYQQMQRNKELQVDVSTVPKIHKKKFLSDRERNKELEGYVTPVLSSAKTKKPQTEESSGDTSYMSRRSKRRRRQAELKLPHARLKAYGKIPSKPKSKKKS